ncbi:ABC transporter ATP-binding protein [Paenibacillus sp. IB182496]|uniref:ABC transporter ATP-binding protein n=1 Tax=Paenibacillus sabuli TaxID=2772509 RepID=A0A927GUR7_9BACL|nr:ABC transporter ATP-binding protein [Paenibacillus sabuli]MBD2848641.1 ABC transporter ATP-binding protein [Paenibacillus sabuli]
MNNLALRLRRLLELGEMRGPIRLLLRYIKRYKLAYIELLLLLLIGVGLTLAYSWFMQQVTDAALLGDVGQLGYLLGMAVLFVALNAVANYRTVYMSAAAVQQVKRDLKNDLMHHLLRLPAGEYARSYSGQYVSHLTNDVNGIDGAIGGNLLGMIRLPIMAAAAFGYLLTINWRLTLVCLALAPAAALGGAIFGKLLRRRSAAIQQLLSRMQVFLGDTFGAQALIRAFTLERRTHRAYEARNEELLQMEMQLARLRGFFQVGAGAAGSAAFFASMGLGAYFVAEGTMSVGELLAFVMLMQYLIAPMTGLAGMWGAFQRALAAVERLVQVLERRTETRSLPAPMQAETGAEAERIELRDVEFGYEPGRPVFDGLSLSVTAGSVLAVVGPSGAGKSTLMQLLLGLERPERGQIVIGAAELSATPIAQWRSKIAYVPQEAQLLSGTIGDNIACGREDATREQVAAAAAAAGAAAFIETLPQGYETEVGERGLRLSGGQRQRIAIARALLKDAPILLLDEATSALDTVTEEEVRAALQRLMAGRTTIVIAHRLSTIRHADAIMVLDGGRIAGVGTHAQLMEQSRLYRRLYQLQYGRQGAALPLSGHG